MKKPIIITAMLAATALAGCERPADVASRNLSYAADRFEVTRRIVFFNGITDKYLMTIEGLCSLGNNDSARQITVTCKTGPDSFKKHFLGLSDNVSFFAEQIDGAKVSTWHYKVVFRPETLLPSISGEVK